MSHLHCLSAMSLAHSNVQYIPSSILQKMGDFTSTWSRGRRESGNSAEQWASDLKTISTTFTCLIVEGLGNDGLGQDDLSMYGKCACQIQCVQRDIQLTRVKR